MGKNSRLQEIEVIEPGETVRLTQVLILIKRDPMVQIPVHVFDHELPIVRAINGEENIEEVEAKEVDVTNFTVAGEYERLVRKYEPSKTSAVADIYGSNPRDLADELGMDYRASRGARTVQKLDQSLIVDNQVDVAVADPAQTQSINRVSGPTVIAGGQDRLPGGANLPGQNARSDMGSGLTGDAADTARVAAKPAAAKPAATAKTAAKPATAKKAATSKKR